MKRELLMLAKVFKNQLVQGWWMSEKLDGMRALWDGGITIGKPLSEIAFANRSMMHRYKTMPICTGLWSRYGNPIQAPMEWISQLPQGVMLDGELYIGHGMFEQTVSITKAYDSPDWRRVKYTVFDSPPVETIFSPGIIRVNGGQNYFIPAGISDWAKRNGVKTLFSPGETFEKRYDKLEEAVSVNKIVKIVEQIPIGEITVAQMMEQTIASGGEGLILKSPHSPYLTKRSDQMLKIKPYEDSEATVVGFVTGKETDKGSKLLGLMGAMILFWNGKQFEISGFTEREREFEGAEAVKWAEENPGKEVPPWITSKYFPRGANVTFTYRELTADGIPKEARFFRKRDE